MFIISYIEGPTITTPADAVFCEDVNGDGKSDCCADGSELGTCTTDQPTFCSLEGVLVQNCLRYGCPGELDCLTGTSCTTKYEMDNPFE